MFFYKGTMEEKMI